MTDADPKARGDRRSGVERRKREGGQRPACECDFSPDTAPMNAAYPHIHFAGWNNRRGVVKGHPPRTGVERRVDAAGRAGLFHGRSIPQGLPTAPQIIAASYFRAGYHAHKRFAASMPSVEKG